MYAYISCYVSVFSVAVLIVHEIGHNLNLALLGDSRCVEDSDKTACEYTDHTCAI